MTNLTVIVFIGISSHLCQVTDDKPHLGHVYTTREKKIESKKLFIVWSWE